MAGVWKKLFPLENVVENEPIEEIVEEIVNLGNDLGFELSAENVKESLEFDEKQLSNEDLIEINQPRAFEFQNGEENPGNLENPKNPAELSYKQLQEILRKGQEFTNFISDLDPIIQTQSKVKKVIDESLRCYREEALEKSKKVVKQTKLELFNKKKETFNFLQYFFNQESQNCHR